MLRDVEQGLTRLSRAAASRDVPRAVDRVSDAVGTTLDDLAGRVRRRGNAVSKDAAQFGDDVLQVGSDILRKVRQEAEHRPLILMAIAIGVGALAAGIFARRR